MKLKASAVLAIVLLNGCLPGAGLNSCVDRVGKCFDVTVDGQPVVPLSASLEKYKSGAPVGRKVDLDRTAWMLAQPVSSQPNPQFAVNQRGGSWFGANPQLEMLVEPLEGQSIIVNRGAALAKSVNAKGKAVITAQNVIAEKTLPPGAYLFTYTLRGTGNWDRKLVFATVK